MKDNQELSNELLAIAERVREDHEYTATVLYALSEFVKQKDPYWTAVLANRATEYLEMDAVNNRTPEAKARAAARALYAKLPR